MSRSDWGALRAYGPAIFGLAVAFVGMMLLERMLGHPNFAGVVSIWRWGPLLIGIAALLHGAWVTWQLWQADRGLGLLCVCGGPLGAERDGRYGPYRRCRCCGKNIARRHYEFME